MSELVDEISDSISDNFRQKRKSPLYAAFIFSWVAHNWQPILVLMFYKGNIGARLSEVVKYKSFYDQIAGPLIWSLILIFFFPFCHALYSFFDSWVGSLHDSSEVKRETLNAKKRTELIMSNIEQKYQEQLSVAEIKENISIKEKAAADNAREVRLILESLESIDDLKKDLLEARKELKESVDSYQLLEKNIQLLKENNKGGHASRAHAAGVFRKIRLSIKEGAPPELIDKEVLDVMRFLGYFNNNTEELYSDEKNSKN
ncbi:hypothetical protein [Pantoea ananatis]|uniref:hypothetical protein n=1 Tax=Pantoea ananas TaxID=553 RepID=UPI001B3176A7|nr:hypothetical protein [Pantoea ananatis]